MTNAKDKHEKQEELKSCPVAAALAPVRQLKKGEQVSALIFEGGGTKGAAYAGVVKALDAAGLVKDVKHFAGASAGAKLPKDTDVIMIDVGDAVSFDDNLEAVEITAMEARGREAVKRYLEYDLPAEVSARNANY